MTHSDSPLPRELYKADLAVSASLQNILFWRIFEGLYADFCVVIFELGLNFVY